MAKSSYETCFHSALRPTVNRLARYVTTLKVVLKKKIKLKSVKLQRGNQKQIKLKSQNHTLTARGTVQDGGVVTR